MGESVDFDLNGLFRLRYIDAEPLHITSLQNHLMVATSPVSTAATPDIVVRFVRRHRPESAVTMVGGSGAGWSGDSFFLIQAAGRARVLTSLPFDNIGVGLEIVADRGVRRIPHLVSLINVILLSKGTLPLHASAFERDGVGIAAAGWSKSGKTEFLLAFRESGLAVADEWCYVDPSTSEARGIPEPVRLEAHHLREVSGLRRAAGNTARVKLWAAGTAGHAAAALARDWLPGKGVIQGIAGVFGEQRHIARRMEDIMPSPPGHRTRLDRLYLLLPGDTASTRIHPVPAEEAAARMVFAHQHHRFGLLADYHRFRYAFPGRSSLVLDGAEATERRLLATAFRSLETFVVELPNPPSVAALQAEVIAHLEGVPAPRARIRRS